MQNFTSSQQSVMSALFNHDSLTKRDLCAITSFSWAAVSKTATQLVKLKLIAEKKGFQLISRGRNPSFLGLSPHPLVVGFSVSSGKVASIVMNLMSETIDYMESGFADDDDPVPVISRDLSSYVRKYGRRIITAGVSFPGLIDSRNGKVVSSVHFPELYDRPVREEILSSLKHKIPVFIERNAVCELIYAVFMKYVDTDTILIAASSGLSAAVFIDGQILHGKSGRIGELGHVTEASSDSLCPCGKRGCIETEVSGKAWHAKWTEKRRHDRSLQESFLSALESEKREAVAVVADSIRFLFPTLSNIVAILAPGKIIISAGIPESAQHIISEGFMKFMGDSEIIEKPKIQFIGIEENSAVRGAALTGVRFLCGDPFYQF